MSVKILERFARKHGWSRDQQIAILLDYIENQQSDAAFADHLRQAADDNEGTPLCDGTMPHTLEEEIECEGTNGEGGLTCLVRCEECGEEGEVEIKVTDVRWLTGSGE